MTKNIAVVNTSPIVYLSSINQLSLLKKLFNEIYIPDAVKQELLSGGIDSFGVKENGFWLSNNVYRAILREAKE